MIKMKKKEKYIRIQEMGRVTLIGCRAGVQPVTARSAEDNPGLE